MITVDLIDNTYVRFAGNDSGSPLVFLHAFGDSGICYEKVFSCESLQRQRLIAVDLWGFGASPRRRDVRTVSDYSSALIHLLTKICSGQAIGLVGHSIAGTMAVRIAERIGEQVRGVFSIEGNLTPDDAMFTGRAANFDDPNSFKAQFLEDIWDMGSGSDELRHYYAGVRFANAKTMWDLGRDAKAISVGNTLGDAFQALAAPKIYYWSEASTPKNTQDWILRSEIPNSIYSGAGHWPMVSSPEVTAQAIASFFRLAKPDERYF